MAITKTIEVNVNSKNAEKNIDSLNSQFEKLGKEGVDVINRIDKNIASTEKSTKSLASGFKGVGLAIKAMGIGLVLEAMGILKDLFMSNEKTANFFGTAIKSLGIVFNDFFGFINKNIGTVTNFFKDIFENPLENIKKFGVLIKENIIERFNSALDVAGNLATALKKLFTGDFSGALDSVKEAGKEMVDVMTGVDDTTGKIGKLANKVGDYAKSVWGTAEALQNMENQAKIAEAQQQRLVEQYDRQAEKLRQVRDNDLISIADRKKANDELATVLNNQEKAMIGVANAQIQQAKNQLAINRNIDNQVALTQALANKEGILAQIEGFRSEQKVNSVSLDKEALDLAKAKQQTETELATNQKLFNAERIKDEEAKLIAQKEAIETQKQLEFQRLQDNINLYKAGTQARIDAENEFQLKKQELENAITTKEDELKAYRESQQVSSFQKQYEAENMSFSARLFSLQAYNQAVLQSETLTQRQKDELLANSLNYEKTLQQQRLALTSNTLGNISNMLGQNSKSGKAFAAAQALINTYQGVTAELATKTATPFEFGIKIANIASTVAIGLKSVRDILKTNPTTSASSSGGGSGISGGSTPAPQVNITQGNVANQIAEGIGTQQPVQAFVVASQVTTQQALDRNIVENATFGN